MQRIINGSHQTTMRAYGFGTWRIIKMPNKPKQPHLDLLGSIFYNSIVTTYNKWGVGVGGDLNLEC